MNQQKASDGAIKVLLRDLESDGNALRTILIKHIHSKNFVRSNILALCLLHLYISLGLKLFSDQKLKYS